MRRVRPKEIFLRIPKPPCARQAKFKIPETKDLPMLETSLLIAAGDIVGARRIFEFGTYLGNTTLNLALNAPADSEIFTFDLAPEMVPDQHPEDIPFTVAHLSSKMAFEGAEVECRIRRLQGNSRTVDLSAYQRSMDLIFIDGGHDLQTVTADTCNACRCWHPEAA